MTAWWRASARTPTSAPTCTLSTDVIVGFPGETDDDFSATLSLVEELRFAALFAFKYSPRPGTAALRLGDAVDGAIADRRLQSLLAMQTRIQLELNRELETRELEVLVTSRGREPERRVGRTACHRLVHFQAPLDEPETCAPGSMVRVRIERALPHSLVGQLIAIESGDPLVGPSTERDHALGGVSSPFEGAGP
jgi:tRNA-2-methylthio-N6-dimethylallyladenosine synthase